MTVRKGLFRIELLFALFLLLSSLYAPVLAGAADVAASKKLSIAVIPERDDLDFWKLLRKGAESVAADDNVEILWASPDGYGSFKGQQRKIEWCIKNKVDAIVISPVHNSNLREPLNKARRKGIPVIQMVSKTSHSINPGYVHSNNFDGGALAADYLSKKINGSGNVILGMFKRGNSPVNSRIKGFKNELKKSGSKLKVIKSIYVGGSPGKGASKVRVALWGGGDDMRKAPKIRAIVGMNESSCEVLLSTLKKMGKPEGLIFVAFNPDPEMVQMIKDGKIAAGVAQDPYRIGRLAVTQAAMTVRGKEIPPETVTKVYLVTKENLSQVKIQQVLGLADRDS